MLPTFETHHIYIVTALLGSFPGRSRSAGRYNSAGRADSAGEEKKLHTVSLHVNKTDIGCINYPLSFFLLVHFHISFASLYSYQPPYPVYFSHAQLLLSYLPHLSHFFCMIGLKFFWTKLSFVHKILQ